MYNVWLPYPLAADVDGDTPAQGEPPSLPSSAPGRRRLKRTMDTVPSDIAPYRKVPRMDKFNYNQTDYSHLPDVSDQARKCDMVFMVTHALETEKIPMWCGFNARIHKDEGEKQVVHYMPNLSQSQETMLLLKRCGSR